MTQVWESISMGRGLTNHLFFAAISSYALLTSTACVEKSRELTEAERQQLEGLVSDAPMKPENALDASFEGKIRLLGYKVTKATWKPGEDIQVTWYWKAEKALDEGWKLFTHVADAVGQSRINADAAGPVRVTYPPGEWKKGQYIKDVQTVRLPADWSSPKAVFFLGLWKGPHRLEVTEGPHDGEDRVRALALPTTAKRDAEPPPLPTLHVVKRSSKLRIDGRLSEPAWEQAPAAELNHHPVTGKKLSTVHKVRSLWDEQRLYLAFEVADNKLDSTYEKHDDFLWKQDAVEMLLKHGGKGYAEIQVSPAGVVFDTYHEAPRQPQPHGRVDWDAEAKAGAVAAGKLNDDEADEGYSVELSLPWKALTPETTYTPKAGDVWQGNFFVMNQSMEEAPATAWSPPMRADFHTPKRFGKLRIVETVENEPALKRANPSPKPPTKAANESAQAPPSP